MSNNEEKGKKSDFLLIQDFSLNLTQSDAEHLQVLLTGGNTGGFRIASHP